MNAWALQYLLVHKWTQLLSRPLSDRFNAIYANSRATPPHNIKTENVLLMVSTITPDSWLSTCQRRKKKKAKFITNSRHSPEEKTRQWYQSRSRDKRGGLPGCRRAEGKSDGPVKLSVASKVILIKDYYERGRRYCLISGLPGNIVRE